jgi:uncharacterized C2H2 Zn-finger protein
MKTTRLERQELAARKHAHQDHDKPIPVGRCPRCPAWIAAVFPPHWYPSRPEKMFLQCPRCDLAWDVRS